MFDVGTPNEVIRHAEEHAYKRTQFCSILQIYGDEVVESIYAYRKIKKFGLQIMQVIKRSTNTDKVYIRSLYCTQFGYTSDFMYEDWDTTYKELGLTTVILNLELLNDTKYRYLKMYNTCPVIKTIKLYKQYPAVEFFLKLNIPLYKSLLKLASEDKSFRKFLYKIYTERDFFTYFNSQHILYAYKNKCSIKEAIAYYDFYRDFHENLIEFDLDFNKMMKYLSKQQLKCIYYRDYYRACIYLKLDMTLDKNLYPNNLKLMHDLRIQEYASVKEKEDAKKKKAFCKKFKNISNKYSFMNYDKDFLIMIAPTVLSLINEGKMLNHCVGKMGYDKKMVNEDSLIFFIREKEHKNKPFVTVEYSLIDKKILQIYACNNTDPSKEVMKFANHWCKIATNRLKKIA